MKRRALGKGLKSLIPEAPQRAPVPMPSDPRQAAVERILELIDLDLIRAVIGWVADADQPVMAGRLAAPRKAERICATIRQIIAATNCHLSSPVDGGVSPSCQA